MKKLLVCALGAWLLASCGGGGGGDDSLQINQTAWVDPGRIQVFGSAETVEMGSDGFQAYVNADGYQRAQQSDTASLSFIGHSGVRPSGAQTQWLRFDMVGRGYFADQGQHLPIVMRFAQYPDPRVTQTPPLSVEGKMIFLGRDEGGSWDCPTRMDVGIYFETRVAGQTARPDIGAVKCADAQPSLKDEVSYAVEIRASSNRIAYSISGPDGRIVSSSTTDDRDYPPLDWNAVFNAQVLNPSVDTFYRDRYLQLDSNQEFAFLAAFTQTKRAWSLKFSRIQSGWD